MIVQKPGLICETEVPPAASYRRTPGRTTAELPNLDLLRAVAVSLVFLNHLGPPLGIRGVAALGHLGVLLFFVHTALVLMMSMERLGLNGTALYTSFMIRRIFRIYPLSILSVVAIIIFALPSSAVGSEYVWPGWGVIFSNLALVQNITGSASVNGVLWSLPFEFQMYLLLPLVFLWLRRSISRRIVLAAWLVAVLITVTEYLVRGGNAKFDEFTITRYFPCFMGGIIAWQLLKRSNDLLPGWLWPIYLGIIVVVYRVLWAVKGVGILVLLHGGRPLATRPPTTWPAYVDFIVEGLICAVVGLALPWFRQISSRSVQSASKLVARYSYGIYLSHSAAIWLCFGKWSTSLKAADVLSSVVLTLAISIAAYHLIEKSFITLGKTFALRLAGHGSGDPRVGLRESTEDRIPCCTPIQQI